jgi:hypothetical protein
LEKISAFVFRRIGVDQSKISINIVSGRKMLECGVLEGYTGYSYRKSLNPSLKRDEVWISNELSTEEIVRHVGHEIGHIITERGAKAEYGMLVAETQAFNIENRFIREFNVIYGTNFTKEKWSSKKNKIYYEASLKASQTKPVLKHKYKL